METQEGWPMRWKRAGWKGPFCLIVSALVLGTGVGLVDAEPPVAAGQADVASLQGLASPDADTQLTTLKGIIERNDTSFLRALTALNDGWLFRWRDAPGSERIVIEERNIEPDGRETNSFLHPFTGEVLKKVDATVVLPEGELVNITLLSSEARRTLKTGLDRLRLFDPDVTVKRATAVKIGNSSNPAMLPALEQALAKESNELVRHDLEVAINRLRLEDPDEEVRRAAAVRLGEIKGLRSLEQMRALLTEEPIEPSDKVRVALQEAIKKIESFQTFQTIIGAAFNGISLGSVLFIMGLGLAITYGLMGVINMAHGEMMMIGAYTAFVLQEYFYHNLSPAWHDSYFFFALPTAFVVTGAFGLLLERSIIRFLYGRPLETLLATWGVSVFLQQAARWWFGDLTSVNPPVFMRGGVEPMVGLVLPYSRIFIIVLAGVALLGVYLLLSRTRVGLLVRAVTQNRNMSACVGISTRKVDSWTFAFGTGLAGIAGCAISLIGNVDPEVGKTYIVESFMVVVVGGVGKLAGTVFSALGIGVLSKILEPVIGGTGGSIYAKLTILMVIILFLQVKPTGLFPAKGRAAEVGT
jgi:urea transport system permease protein